MRRQAIIGALLLIGVGVVLGATVFRTDIAQATGLAQSVTVDNTTTNPVPVNVTNRVVPVHEQGTAQIAVTVGLSASANSVKIDPTNASEVCGLTVLVNCEFDQEIEASLVVVDFQEAVTGITLRDSTGAVTLTLSGPSGTPGQSHYVLPLTQPIRVKRLDLNGCSTVIQCFAAVHIAGTAVP